MSFVRPEIQTYCMGQAASAAAVLLAAGTKGKRFALEHSRVLIHQPSGEGQGQVTDLEIQANEILRMRVLLEEILARHTGQTVEQVKLDIERDRILTADAGQGLRHRRRGHLHPQARQRTERCGRTGSHAVQLDPASDASPRGCGSERDTQLNVRLLGRFRGSVFVRDALTFGPQLLVRWVSALLAVSEIGWRSRQASEEMYRWHA